MTLPLLLIAAGVAGYVWAGVKVTRWAHRRFPHEVDTPLDVFFTVLFWPLAGGVFVLAYAVPWAGIATVIRGDRGDDDAGS